MSINNCSGESIVQHSLGSVGSSSALIFSSSIPTVTNIFSSAGLIEKALGMSAEKLAEKINKYTNDATLFFDTATHVRYLECSLSQLPLPKHHKDDISGSINLGCTIYKSEGKHKSSIYRIQPLSDSKAVIHCDKNSGLMRAAQNGERDITIAISTSPALVYASAASLPERTDTLSLASYISPAKMTFSNQFTHPVPVKTQIVIEAEITEETHPEGPFVTYIGLSDVKQCPVIAVKSVMILNDAVYQTTVTGKTPSETSHLLTACAEIHNHRLKSAFPGAHAKFDHSKVYFESVDIFCKSEMDKISDFLTEDYFFSKFKEINLLQH